MRITIFIAFFWLIFTSESLSQELFWKAGIFSFFDNAEFGKSVYKVPQTMSGVQVIPGIGVKWDSLHIIGGGINLLHEFGSSEVVDRISLTAFYEFSGRQQRFIMGAFPRNNVLDKYPRIFFQDSITYYRPDINGASWEFHSGRNYLNLWFDWTSQISETVRETFFVGLSGRYASGIFYLQHYNYLFHYAKDLDPVVEKGIYDNLLFLTSAGIDLSGKTFLDLLDVNAGWISGIERDRAGESGWITNSGLLAEVKIGYRIFGIFNSLYIGEGQMSFYENHSNELYWGDPIYRAGSYNRSDFYINFISNKKLNLNLTYSLHFAEGRVYHEQMLKASVNLNNL